MRARADGRGFNRSRARTVLQAQWPILLVGLTFAAAFVLAAANFWRRGSLLIGIGVGLAAVLRLVLPDERAGLLAVRSKGSAKRNRSLLRRRSLRLRHPFLNPRRLWQRRSRRPLSP